jgi:hypothetical protein
MQNKKIVITYNLSINYPALRGKKVKQYILRQSHGNPLEKKQTFGPKHNNGLNKQNRRIMS